MLLVAGFSACTDDIGLNVAPPQSYPQEAPQVIDGFTIAVGADFNSAIVITEEVKELQVVKATATPTLAEGATVVFRTEISDTQDFTNKVVELPTTSANNAATTTSSELNELIKTMFGKAPKARTIYLRTYFYILDGTSASMIPTPYIYGPVTVTPHSIVTIEPAYYLIGDVNGWNFDNLDDYKFAHSDADVYDDPIFTITVLMPAGYFKIVPQSGKDADSWDGVIGNPVDGNTELEGMLIVDDAQAMRVLESQWVKITLDMMDATYKIELLGNAKRQLYVPGGHQGWSPDSAPIVYSPNLDWKFDGYVFMQGGNEFKFTSERNWDGTNYGKSGDGTLSTDDGAGNLTVSENGFYRLTVDLSKEPYTYTVTATDWGLIGDATPGGWDASTPMTLNAATGEWSVTAALAGGKEFKFRANNGWDINLGGDVNNLTYGGGNIPVDSDGTYLITLKLGNASAYTYTIVKQ
ncbi:hypothetical protein AGMMS50239_38540 [Bacteroidia bacterium]|nr:hypothetical protein AGMMS50239_38540 [Bacteroidia bacterium]